MKPREKVKWRLNKAEQELKVARRMLELGPVNAEQAKEIARLIEAAEWAMMKASTELGKP